MISLLILSLQVAQCLSRPFKMKAEHPCMAYTIESWQPSSCLLLDWLSPSCGSWMPFAWPCFVLLWCFCSHRRPGLQSASPSPAPHPDPTSLPAVPSGTCRVYHPKDLWCRLMEIKHVKIHFRRWAFSKCAFSPGDTKKQLWTLPSPFLDCLSEFLQKIISSSLSLVLSHFLLQTYWTSCRLYELLSNWNVFFWNVLISPLFWDKCGLIYPLNG